MALPRGAIGWSSVCDCGIFWSYSLTFDLMYDAGWFHNTLTSLWSTRKEYLVLYWQTYGNVQSLGDWHARSGWYEGHSIRYRPTLLLIKICLFFFYKINLYQDTLRPYVWQKCYLYLKKKYSHHWKCAKMTWKYGILLCSRDIFKSQISFFFL